VLISIRVFDSADEAFASNEIAASWMRDNVLEFVKGMPEVIAGNVLVAEAKTAPTMTDESGVGAKFALLTKRPFFLIVIDEDRDVFSIEGPMTDDQPWQPAARKTRDDERHVVCAVRLAQIETRSPLSFAASASWRAVIPTICRPGRAGSRRAKRSTTTNSPGS
jgi:hypothetical protein